MVDIIIENVAQIVATLFITLIGVLGAWLTTKLGQRQELSSINIAMQEVILLAQQTAAELQQTVVDGLKAGRVDGKLTEAEIKALGSNLVELTMQKMSAPTTKLLNGAAVDVSALIKGAGESWINKMKTDQTVILPGEILEAVVDDIEK